MFSNNQAPVQPRADQFPLVLRYDPADFFKDQTPFNRKNQIHKMVYKFGLKPALDLSKKPNGGAVWQVALKQLSFSSQILGIDENTLCIFQGYDSGSDINYQIQMPIGTYRSVEQFVATFKKTVIDNWPRLAALRPQVLRIKMRCCVFPHFFLAAHIGSIFH